MKLPLAPLRSPITEGPTRPLRFEIELISGMPPAAALPVRNVDGSTQNGPVALRWPTIAIDSASMISAGECT